MKNKCKKCKKRVAAIVMCVCLLVGLMPTTVFAAGGSVTLPVRTIEEDATDIKNYVHRNDLTATFTSETPFTAAEFGEWDYLGIDYYWAMKECLESLEVGYDKPVIYDISIPLTGFTGDSLEGTITVPLPSGYDGATAKIVGGATATSSTETTVTFPVKLSVGDNKATASFVVEYKKQQPHTHSYGDWQKDVTNHWHECACGEKADVAAHTWDGGVVTTAATATTAGVKTYTCTVCQATKTEAIPATGKTDAGKTDAGQSDAPQAPAVGTKVTDAKSKAVYKITNAKKREVAYAAPTSKTVKTVVIPDTISKDGITYKVTSIASKACYKCTKLTKVTMGKNVKTIGSNAFSKCTALKSVTLPSKVEKIESKAFYGCKKLAKITIQTTKLTDKKVGSSAFKGIYAKAKIKVPKAKLKTYKTLLKKKGIGSKVKVY